MAHSAIKCAEGASCWLAGPWKSAQVEDRNATIVPKPPADLGLPTGLLERFALGRTPMPVLERLKAASVRGADEFERSGTTHSCAMLSSSASVSRVVQRRRVRAQFWRQRAHLLVQHARFGDFSAVWLIAQNRDGRMRG